VRFPTRTLAVWVGLLVSAGFAYLALRDVHLAVVWHGLRRSNYWWLAPALAALALANVVRAVRWRYLFAAESRPPLRNVFSAMLLGIFFNNVLPARAGEAARIVALKQSSGTSRAEAAGTVVLERVYDLLVVLGLLFVLLPWLPHVSWLRAAAILAIGLSGGVVAAFVVLAVYGERLLRTILRPLGRLPLIPLERAEVAAVNLTRGFTALRRLRLAALALATTTLSWLLFGISAWCVMRGFALGLSPVAGMLVIVAVALGMILPSSPAAVGVFEAAVLVALGAYDIPKSQALSYALVLHAVNFLPYIAAGVAVTYVHVLGLRTRVQPS